MWHFFFFHFGVKVFYAQTMTTLSRCNTGLIGLKRLTLSLDITFIICCVLGENQQNFWHILVAQISYLPIVYISCLFTLSLCFTWKDLFIFFELLLFLLSVICPLKENLTLFFNAKDQSKLRHYTVKIMNI